MALTDELREWARSHRAELNLGQLSERTILDIANRIQTTATTDTLDAWFNGYSRAIDEFGDRSMHLPVDMDGIPIRVGDVMEAEKIGGCFGEPFEVIGYIMSNGELEPIDEHKCPRKRKYLRHYHEPTTVEGVLREFAERYLDYEGMPSAGRRGVSEALMDEYAARLRLAEESDTL